MKWAVIFFYFIFIIKEILSFRSSFCYSCISGFCLFGHWCEKITKMVIIIHMIIFPVKTSQHLTVCGFWGICSVWLNKVQCKFWRLTCNIKYSYRHYKNAKCKIIIPSKRRTWLRRVEVGFFFKSNKSQADYEKLWKQLFALKSLQLLKVTVKA